MAPSVEGKAIFSTNLGRHPPRAAETSPPPHTIARSVPPLHNGRCAPDVAEFTRTLWQKFPNECARVHKNTDVMDYFDSYDIQVLGCDFLQTVILSIANQSVVNFSYHWTREHGEKVSLVGQGLELQEIFSAEDVTRYGVTFLKEAFKYMRRCLRTLQAQKGDKELGDLPVQTQGGPLNPRSINEKATEASIAQQADTLKLPERRVTSEPALEVPVHGARNTFSKENRVPSGTRAVTPSSMPVSLYGTPALSSRQPLRNGRSSSARRIELTQVQAQQVLLPQTHLQEDQQVLSPRNQQPFYQGLTQGLIPTPPMQQAHLLYSPGALPNHIHIAPHPAFVSQPVIDATGAHALSSMHPYNAVHFEPHLYPIPSRGQLYHPNNVSRGNFNNRGQLRNSFSNDIDRPWRVSSEAMLGRGGRGRGAQYLHHQKHPRRDSIGLQARYEQSQQYHEPSYEQSRAYHEAPEKFSKFASAVFNQPDGEYGCDKFSIGSDREDIFDLWVSGLADDVAHDDIVKRLEDVVTVGHISELKRDSGGAPYVFASFHKTADARKALELNGTLFQGQPIKIQVPEKYWNPHHSRRYSQTYAGSARGSYGHIQRRSSIASRGPWEDINGPHSQRRRSSLVPPSIDAVIEQMPPSGFSRQDVRSGRTTLKHSNWEERSEGSKPYRDKIESGSTSPKKSGHCTPSGKNDMWRIDAPTSTHSSSSTERSSSNINNQKCSKPQGRKSNIDRNKKSKEPFTVESSPKQSMRQPSQIHTIVESASEIGPVSAEQLTSKDDARVNAQTLQSNGKRSDSFVNFSCADEAVRFIPNDTNESWTTMDSKQPQDPDTGADSEGSVTVASTSADTKPVSRKTDSPVPLSKGDEMSGPSTSVQDAESHASSETVDFDPTSSVVGVEPESEEVLTVKLSPEQSSTVQSLPTAVQLTASSTASRPTIKETGSIHPFAKQNKPKKQPSKKPRKGETKKQKKGLEVATPGNHTVPEGSAESSAAAVVGEKTEVLMKEASNLPETLQSNAEVKTPLKTNHKRGPTPLHTEDNSSPIQRFEDARETVNPETPQPTESPLPGDHNREFVATVSKSDEKPQPSEASLIAVMPIELVVAEASRSEPQPDPASESTTVSGVEPATEPALKKKSKPKKKKKNKATESIDTTLTDSHAPSTALSAAARIASSVASALPFSGTGAEQQKSSKAADV